MTKNDKIRYDLYMQLPKEDLAERLIEYDNYLINESNKLIEEIVSPPIRSAPQERGCF